MYLKHNYKPSMIYFISSPRSILLLQTESGRMYTERIIKALIKCLSAWYKGRFIGGFFQNGWEQVLFLPGIDDLVIAVGLAAADVLQIG